MESMVTNVLPVIFGGLITFFCSKYYYEKASLGFKKEAEDLRHLMNVTLCVREALGWIEIEMDKQGKISGFNSIIQLKDGTKYKVFNIAK